ncbi:MAG: c-type cytochrome biogenesis protein CcmI [Gammaproteobacteria bacterium]|nr:MAG: c-type cytochrome biogenesis protein CcmI [Gammaproteobacteria bacterium]
MSMMIWFVLMIVVSTVWLVWFLKNPLTSNLFNLEKSNVALGKQKQAELEQDLKQNLIDESEFNQAKDEIAQTLAIELNQVTGVDVLAQKNIPLWSIGLMITFLVVASLGIYQLLTPQLKSLPVPQMVEQLEPPSLEQSMAELKKYLEENDNDFEAWQTLGLLLFELDDIDGSLKAYERSYQLNSKNVSMLVEYASTVAISQNDQFVGRASTLVREALEINPNAPDALYLAGLVAVNAGQFDLSRQLWKKALSLLPQDHPDRSILEGILVELAQIQGEPMPEYQVVINVDLPDRLRQDEFKNHYLMIYVKAAQGRPMPIAIQKIQLKDFTGSVILTDENSVMPSSKLSQSSQVIAVVRLSQSGSAMKQEGDIQVLSSVIDVRDNPTLNLQVE